MARRTRQILIFTIAFWLSHTHHILGQSQSTIKDSLRQALHSCTNSICKADAYTELAQSFGRSNLDSSIHYARLGYELSLRIGHKEGVGKNLLKIGNALWTSGYIDSAQHYYKTALDKYSEYHDLQGISKSHQGLGIINGIKGQYIKGLEHFQKALQIFEKTKDLKSQSGCLNNIGIIHKKAGNTKLAIEYYMRSYIIDSIRNDNFAMSSVSINIGSLYLQENKPKLAEPFIRKSLRLKEKSGDIVGLNLCYNNLGNIHFQKENFDSALYYYNLAIQNNISTNNLKSSAISLNSKGEVFKTLAIKTNKQAFVDSAISAITASLEISEKMDIRPTTQTSHKLLYDLYKHFDNYQLSLHHLEQFNAIRDSLFNTEKMKALEALEAKYQGKLHKQKIKELEHEKGLKETTINKQQNRITSQVAFSIVLLLLFLIILPMYRQKKKSNKELWIQKEKIEAQMQELEQVNQTRDTLYSLIAHDLKSPFNSLIGLTDFLLQNNNDMDHTDQQEIIKTINQTSSNTFTLLINLLEWSRLQSGNLTPKSTLLNMRDMAENAIGHLHGQSELKSISLNIEIDKKIMVHADSTMLASIIRNLVANAIKFTPGKGQITVMASEHKGYISCSIIDNGTGMTEQQTKNIFNNKDIESTSGTSGEKGTGLGLKLCQGFIEILGGKLSIKSQQNKGSTFTFTIPTTEE